MARYRVEATKRAESGAVMILDACEIEADTIINAEIAADRWARLQLTNASVLRVVRANMIMSERLFHKDIWTRWCPDEATGKAAE